MVELKVYGGNAAGWSGGAVVLLLREEDCRSVPEVPCRDAVKELAARKDFTGKAGTSLRVPLLSGGVRNLFLVGLGSGEDEACSAEAVRNALTAALREAGRHRCESALVPMEHLNVGGGRPFGPEAPDWSVVVGEASGLSGYAFDKYKERKEDDDEGAFALREVLVPRWPCVRVLTKTDPAPARLSPVTVPDLSDADPDAFLSGMSGSDLPS